MLSPPLLALRSWALMLLPACAIALLWWPSLPNSFQFDDWNVIVNEPRVHSLAAWWHSMPGIRPLLKLSYALNFSAVADDPLGFRLVNVLIHALNATLVCCLLRERGLRAGLDQTQTTQAALFATLLFALHPVQTEAVTYISGRSSSLAACFCLLSLYCWVRSEQGSKAWLIACGASYVAAVATKETALILPLALWLYGADQPTRATLQRLLPLLALTAALTISALSLPKYRYLLGVSLDTRTVGENLLTQSHALLYLAGQLVRIRNGNADPQLPIVTAADPVSVLLSLAWLVVLIAAVLNVRKAPAGAFALLWFLLWLAPTNSLLPRLDVANDRQLYLAVIGPAWWLAVRIVTLPIARPAMASFAAALLLLPLMFATLQRNRIYQTEITYWEDTALRNPTNARAANNLGIAYAFACRGDDAAAAFDHSIAMSPEDFRARINRRLLRDGQLPGVDPDRCR